MTVLGPIPAAPSKREPWPRRFSSSAGANFAVTTLRLRKQGFSLANSLVPIPALSNIFRSIVLIGALALANMPSAADEHGSATQFWQIDPAVVTVIHDGRPEGLLNVVAVVDMGTPSKVDAVARDYLLVRDHFLLALENFAANFDPRHVIDVEGIRRAFQEALNSAIGSGRGRVYITSAYMASPRHLY